MENNEVKKGIFESLRDITSEEISKILKQKRDLEANESGVYNPEPIDTDINFSKWFQANRESDQEIFAKMKNL